MPYFRLTYPLRPYITYGGVYFAPATQPSPEMCLTHRDEAITWLLELELATAP